MAMKVLSTVLNHPSGHLAAALPVHTETMECTLHLQTSSAGAADHVKNLAMSWNFCFFVSQQVYCYQREFQFFGTTTAA